MAHKILTLDSSSPNQPSPCKAQATTISSGFAEASAPHVRHSGLAESLRGCLLWHSCGISDESPLPRPSPYLASLQCSTSLIHFAHGRHLLHQSYEHRSELYPTNCSCFLKGKLHLPSASLLTSFLQDQNRSMAPISVVQDHHCAVSEPAQRGVPIFVLVYFVRLRLPHDIFCI